MGVYHERQIGNFCRCHALNNLLGTRIVTTQEFNGLCDEFDNIHTYEKGCSRNKYFFINNGGEDNIFGYILHKKDTHYKMNHYDIYTNKTIIPHKNSIGFIVYNQNHTFCIRKIDSTFYLIDSMRSNIIKVNPQQYGRRGFGLIDIFRP